jgi:ADP-ribose pyrophosphatase YjhB (NUDIX family)
MPILNLRVYGILFNEQHDLLVSDEYIRGSFFTKFPGGGLEYGEGTRDCLKREFLEEMNLNIEVGEHIYTTDFFQLSAFHVDHQIISIYYFVKPLEEFSVPLREAPFQFDDAQMKVYEAQKEVETFRFIRWKNVSEDSVSLPIDKLVVKMLKGQR